MKNPSRALALAGALALISSLAACGQGGGGDENLADTPEGQAYIYRHALMEVIAYKLTPLGAMARGEVPADETQFVEWSGDLAALSQMVAEGFMPEGLVEQSRSMPEIWTDWSGFEQRLQQFEDAASSLAEAAEDGGFEAARGLVRNVQDSCGSCHRAYRAPEEP